jgi:hypothetical protein
MGKKIFGAQRGPAKREEFTMVFRQGENKEVPHNFRAIVRMDAAGLKRALGEMKENSETGLPVMFSVIAGQLDDLDGVPDLWVPIPLLAAPEIAPVWPPADDAEPASSASKFEPIPQEFIDREGVPADAVFVAPWGDLRGQVRPWSEVEEYTTHVAGSSRRRWVDLIDNHEELAIEMDDVMELFKWLIGLATERPTRPSA